jgi:hypothetical protein
MPFSFGTPPHFAGDLETIAEVSLNVTLECKALALPIPSKNKPIQK